MKLHVLALDYDGTIAEEGRLEPVVRRAIIELRKQGFAVVLVTGRILSQLRELVGGLALFDAVVAENGAVLAFPETGASTVLGAPPPEAFLAELRRRGLEHLVGQSVVELDAGDACAALEAIRALELPLALLFNRGRLMVLPQSISKGTGLREALRVLRLSPHNALGVGDAENDGELLRVCELSYAVEWGSAALRDYADRVLAGSGPPAVAELLRDVGRQARMDLSGSRRRLLLGRDADGSPLELAVRGRNLLIAGDPRSGKSWVGGLLCEQLVLMGYGLCVIDPEGDYRALESLPGVLMLGGDPTPPRLHDLARALRGGDASVIVDLAQVPHAEKRPCVLALLSMLKSMRRQNGLPHRILVDEAHYFLNGAEALEDVDLDLGGYLLVTYRVSALHLDVHRACGGVIVTRETDPQEARALRKLCAGREPEAQWEETLAGLAMDEAALLPGIEEAGGRLRRFRIAPRLTRHVRHRHKYLDVPLPAELGFWFAGSRKRARTLQELCAELERAPVEQLAGHIERGDFSRWIEEVLHDHVLAGQVRELEEAWRLGRLADVNGALIRVVKARYAPPEEPVARIPAGAG